MNKKVGVLLLVSVLIFSVLVSSFLVSGETIPRPDSPLGYFPGTSDTTAAKTPQSSSDILTDMAKRDPTGCDWLLNERDEEDLKNGFTTISDYFFYERCVLWIGGAKINELDATQANVIARFLKWFFLFLVILLIYSALSFAEFPQKKNGEFSGFLGILISIIVGLLATFFITTQELISAMLGYSALGMTLIIFFPILILGFFTVMTARKLSPIGIYLQRVLWLIYSVFLFLKTFILFAIMRGWGYWATIKDGAIDVIKDKALEAGATHYQLFGFVFKINYSAIQNYDVATITTLLVVSIAVFIIMVVGGKAVNAWLAKESAEADIAAHKQKLNLSEAKVKQDAAAMQH